MSTTSVLVLGGGGLLLLALVSLLSPTCQQHWYMTSVYWRKSQPVRFYGQVVDQKGTPIPGATVSIMIEDFNRGTFLGSRDYMNQRRLTRTTGSDGKFLVTGTTAMQLIIEKVEHPDYLRIPERKWDVLVAVDGFNYARGRAPRYVPDPQKPAIFPLRKEGEERVLWPTRGGRDEPNPR